MIQEARLNVAQNDLDAAQAILDEKQRELDVVQAMYDGAMKEKQVGFLVTRNLKQRNTIISKRIWCNFFPEKTGGAYAAIDLIIS